MAVRIRLARAALTRNSPRYTLVATLSSSRTTAKPLETLGSYSPLPVISPPVSLSPNGEPRSIEQGWGPGYYKSTAGQPRAEVGEKSVKWNVDRLRYWLSVGAKPSKPVERLLNQAGILKTNYIPAPSPTQSKNKLSVSRDRRIRDAVRLAEKERGEVPVAQR
ncbi:hypothetical protein JCM16303_002862 [Sporobolomyces ruberrimus]